MGGAHPFLTWMALSFIIWQTLATTTSYPSVPRLNHSSDPDPMAIQTRTSSVKTRRAAKANTSAGIRPRRNTRSTSLSPQGENVNAHLAELNLPSLRFDKGLTVLRKERQDDINNPCILKVPTSKETQEHAPPDSPVGVKESILVPILDKDTSPPIKQAQPVVKINKNPTPAALQESPATLDNNTAPSSVLKKTLPRTREGGQTPDDTGTVFGQTHPQGAGTGDQLHH
jgi:hypothetical protein